MENRNEIIEKIHLELISAHNTKGNFSREEWTDIFKEKLISLGHQLKYKVYASYSKKDEITKADGGEYLLDLVWSDENDNGNKDDWKTNYKGLTLACEIEWNMNDNDILHDFQKLAIVKSDIKLMVVQFNNEIDFKNWIRACEKSIDKSLWDDGSTYILCGSQNGKDGKLRFVRLWNK